MSLPETRSDISQQEATDLLGKLITESTNVRALFNGISALTAGIMGRVSPLPDGTFVVRAGADPADPFLRFDPREAVAFKYGYSRTRPTVMVPGWAESCSILMFIYRDMTQVALLEISAHEP